MKITILGCGPSQGVPVIGNRWGKCDPTNPRNNRTRPSILVEENGTAILVDTSPDIRTQFLSCGISHVDAVLFTHLHYDHVGGIGELRTLSFIEKHRIDVFGTPDVMQSLTRDWRYLFSADGSHESQLYKPVAEPHLFNYGDNFDIKGIEIKAFLQDHGICNTAGFRFGNFAYSTDVVNLSDEAFSILEGIDVWVVDCLRTEPHPTHAHFEQTLSWINRIKPKRAIFTHMNFQTDYETLKSTPGCKYLGN